MTSPLDDIRTLLTGMPTLVDAPEAPDRLTDMRNWMAAAQDKTDPSGERAVIALFSGGHGVARHGVSAMSMQDAAALSSGIADGSAQVAKLCVAGGIGLKLLDLAPDIPTADIISGPAMDERDAAATMAFGMEAAAGGHNLLVLGGFGVGADAAATAVLTALGHASIAPDVVRPDIGLRLNDAVSAAIKANSDGVRDSLDLMARLGGREIAAIAGAIIACRYEKIPVILEGPSALAAACALAAMRADAIAHCRAAFDVSNGGMIGGLPLSLISVEPGLQGGFAATLVRASLATD